MSLLPPPPPEARAGDRIPAGLGFSTILPDFDFETYSEAGFVWDEVGDKWTSLPNAAKKGLPVVGAANYAKHPTAEVLCMAYNLKQGEGRKLWRPGLPVPQDLFAYLTSGGLIEAHNVGFERWIWEEVCVKKMGWPAINPSQYRCSAAKARASALPGALGELAKVLGTAQQKDGDGKRLIDKFTMPRNPTKADPRRRIPNLWTPADAEREFRSLESTATTPRQREKLWAMVWDDHLDTLKLGDYCLQDIATESDVSARLPDLEGEELQWWQHHEEINHRGVPIDIEGVKACAAIIEQTLERYNAELKVLTGIDAASKVAQIQGWLKANGFHLYSLDQDSVEEAMARPDVTGVVRRVLEIRGLAGSASVKKVFAMRNRATPEGLLHDLYIFCGAHTGRSTGEGPQPTNLPNSSGLEVFECECGRHYGLHLNECPWCGASGIGAAVQVEWNAEAASDALETIRHRDYELLERYWGDALGAVSACLRGLFKAPDGEQFLSSDWNSIEAVGLAMLSGEKWRIEVFNTHGKIYEVSGAKVMGVSFEEMMEYKKRTGNHHPARKPGKVYELACLGADTLVVTKRGPVRIVDVQAREEVWDGEEWIRQWGPIFRGFKQVIDVDGLTVTPDHLVSWSASWLPASQLVSSRNILSQCLERTSATFCTSAFQNGLTVSIGPFLWRATVARALTALGSTISGRGARRAALLALLEPARERPRCTGDTPTWSPTTSTADGSSIGSPPALGAATTHAIKAFTAMGVAASLCTSPGAPTRGHFLRTWSRLKAGTNRTSTWIAEKWTEVMSQATSALSRVKSTMETAGRFGAFKSESQCLRPVYDLRNSGPRSRFVVLTDTGALTVHNCGYGGWIGSAHAFDAPGTDDEIKKGIIAWRDASPAVVHFWGGQSAGKWQDRQQHLFGVEGMFIAAVQQPDRDFPVMRLDGTHSGVTFRAHGSRVYCTLPSGRRITYNDVSLHPSTRQYGAPWDLEIRFWGWNTNPKNGPPGWIQKNTYGPKLVENINQATCRDILRHAVAAHEARGYPVVLHVYDELVGKVKQGRGSVAEYEAIMMERPAWAHDWPIRAAGGWRGGRYAKG